MDAEKLKAFLKSEHKERIDQELAGIKGEVLVGNTFESVEGLDTIISVDDIPSILVTSTPLKDGALLGVKHVTQILSD